MDNGLILSAMSITRSKYFYLYIQRCIHELFSQLIKSNSFYPFKISSLCLSLFLNKFQYKTCSQNNGPFIPMGLLQKCRFKTGWLIHLSIRLWQLLPAPYIYFLYPIRICEWTFIILLMKTKEVRIFWKTFFERDWIVEV